jgi:hypothetical protein
MLATIQGVGSLLPSVGSSFPASEVAWGTSWAWSVAGLFYSLAYAALLVGRHGIGIGPWTLF